MKKFVDKSMCQVLGMDEGIYDMRTCTYCTLLKVGIPCASNFALGTMLNQNPDKTIDRPIYYANRLMDSAKKNYTTSEKKTLAMIYVGKKFNIIFWEIASHSLWIIKFVIFGK
jgi:hypothetical protein